MKNADKVNVNDEVKRVIFRAAGIFVVIWSTAKLKAARVPGAQAFRIGFKNFSSKSSMRMRSPEQLIWVCWDIKLLLATVL